MEIGTPEEQRPEILRYEDPREHEDFPRGVQLIAAIKGAAKTAAAGAVCGAAVGTTVFHLFPCLIIHGLHKNLAGMADKYFLAAWCDPATGRYSISKTEMWFEQAPGTLMGAIIVGVVCGYLGWRRQVDGHWPSEAAAAEIKARLECIQDQSTHR